MIPGRGRTRHDTRVSEDLRRGLEDYHERNNRSNVSTDTHYRVQDLNEIDPNIAVVKVRPLY